MNLSVPTVEEVAKDDNLNFKVFAFEEVPKVDKKAEEKNITIIQHQAEIFKR
ncbi:unnamed protein product [Brassica rapa subsp. narinosa]